MEIIGVSIFLGVLIALAYIGAHEAWKVYARSKLEAEWDRQSKEFKRRRDAFCAENDAWYDPSRDLFIRQDKSVVPEFQVPDLTSGLDWIGSIGNYPKHLERGWWGQ